MCCEAYSWLALAEQVAERQKLVGEIRVEYGPGSGDRVEKKMI